MTPGPIVVVAGPPGAGKTTVSRLLAQALTEEEPIRQMWHEFDGLGAYERHVLDSTELDPDQTTAAVSALLDDGALRT